MKSDAFFENQQRFGNSNSNFTFISIIMQKVPRSRAVLMLSASEIPEISNWNWDSILPPKNDQFYETFDNQVAYLRRATDIKIKDLCKLLRISTTTFYILYPVHPAQNSFFISESPGRPSLVNPEDESALLQFIENC